MPQNGWHDKDTNSIMSVVKVVEIVRLPGIVLTECLRLREQFQALLQRTTVRLWKKQWQELTLEFPILIALSTPSSHSTPPKPRPGTGATLIYLSVRLLLRCFKKSKRNKGGIIFTWNLFRLTRGVFFAFLKQTESHKHIINTVYLKWLLPKFLWPSGLIKPLKR